MRLSPAVLLAAGLASSAVAVPSTSPEFFSHGLAPVDTGEGTGAATPPSERCGRCHVAEARDWEGSRHHDAWTNRLFGEGFEAEMQVTRCVYCHAPLEQQLRELVKPVAERRLVREGVNCATCHVREGVIHGVRGRSGAHETRTLAALAKPSFCAGCHQFNFSRQLHGEILTQPLASQNTFVEWEQYQAGGGMGTCQDCHMPDHRHVFRGAHDEPYLRGAIRLTVSRAGDEVRFSLRTVGVGHHVPTGDLFRRITLEVEGPGAGDYREVASIGRSFTLVKDPGLGTTIQRLVSDTSIAPGQVVSISCKERGPLAYRLRYHYTSNDMERHSAIPQDGLLVTLSEGVVGGSNAAGSSPSPDGVEPAHAIALH